MQVVRSNSADDALFNCLMYMAENPALLSFADSRNGPVIRFKEPLSSVYTNPRSRTLFNPVRDNNPFFSVFESLWMLAGRNDTHFVSYLLKNMANYSDDGITLNGAYGHRWRKHFHIDQLKFIIDELEKDPNSRRAHLQMWDPFRDVDLLIGPGSKDLPCNTAVDFEIQDGKLNMMVSNRSNDLIWGAYGANIVHFSFLQEYIACALGVEVGVYTQVSRNAHIYVDNPVTKRLLTVEDHSISLTDDYLTAQTTLMHSCTPSPLLFEAEQRDEFDNDLQEFFEFFDEKSLLPVSVLYETEFMSNIVSPMSVAFDLYKRDHLEDAVKYLQNLQSNSDWIVNSIEWLQRRIDKRNSNGG